MGRDSIRYNPETTPMIEAIYGKLTDQGTFYQSGSQRTEVAASAEVGNAFMAVIRRRTMQPRGPWSQWYAAITLFELHAGPHNLSLWKRGEDWGMRGHLPPEDLLRTLERLAPLPDLTPDQQIEIQNLQAKQQAILTENDWGITCDLIEDELRRTDSHFEARRWRAEGWAALGKNNDHAG